MEWIKTNIKRVKRGGIFYLRKNGKKYEKGVRVPVQAWVYYCWDTKASRPVQFHFARTCWIRTKVIDKNKPMGNSKISPGPWEKTRAKTEDWEPIEYHIVDKNGYFVASTERDDADARAIAEVPGMIRMVKEFRDHLVGLNYFASDDDAFIKTAKKIKKAESLLARIEGEDDD